MIKEKRPHIWLRQVQLDAISEYYRVHVLEKGPVSGGWTINRKHLLERQMLIIQVVEQLNRARFFKKKNNLVCYLNAKFRLEELSRTLLSVTVCETCQLMGKGMVPCFRIHNEFGFKPNSSSVCLCFAWIDVDFSSHRSLALSIRVVRLSSDSCEINSHVLSELWIL